jgi:hypothetical protein
VRGFDDQYFWRDKNGAEYRRIAAGLAWPAKELPGWIVILGEDRNKRGDGKRHISVIHDWKGVGAKGGADILSPRDIMAEASALSVSMTCDVWVSPTELPDAALLPMYNRSLGRHDRKLSLRTPPRYERASAFLVYDRLLEYRTAREHTFHFFGAGGRRKALADEYAVIRAEDKNSPLEEFPAVAALLYALAWVEFTGAGGHAEWAGRQDGGYRAATIAGY